MSMTDENLFSSNASQNSGVRSRPNSARACVIVMRTNASVNDCKNKGYSGNSENANFLRHTLFFFKKARNFMTLSPSRTIERRNICTTVNTYMCTHIMSPKFEKIEDITMIRPIWCRWILPWQALSYLVPLGSATLPLWLQIKCSDIY